jgi:hypothetical protein
MGIFESTMEDKANTAANSHPSESPPIPEELHFHVAADES